MKYRKFQKVLAVAVAGAMVLSSGSLVALADYGADDYTQQAQERDGGVGGTVFGENGTLFNEDGSAITFNENTDYYDETFLYDGPELEETSYPDKYDKDNMDPMTGEELEEVLDALVASMTYDEKIHLVSMNSDPEGRDGVGYMTGVPRLGVPESRMHDGPSGVSTSTSSTDAYVETTNFPLQMVATMTWSTDAMREYGEQLGREQVAIGSGWQLGMQMDLVRNPHWARAKDALGEDYVLAAAMAVAETQGIESEGGIPMAKHIGAYSTDGDTSLWVRVDEQTLNTAYLYTFESAAKEANLSSIMGTYNRLNGYYVSSNYHLQVEILRDMWNWEGAMVPDWGADQDQFSLILGTTISQEGATTISNRFRSAAYQGLITMDDLDAKARQSLYALGVSGYLNAVELDGNGYVKQDLSRAAEDEFGQMSSDYANIADSRIQFERTILDEDGTADQELLAQGNDVALEIAEKGITLAKNENDALPLTEEDYTGDNSVAYIGYGAVNLIGGTGGERSFGTLQYMTTPLESTLDIVGEDANVEGYILDDIHGVSVSDVTPVYTDEEMTTEGWIMRDEMVEGDLSSGSGGGMFPGAPFSADDAVTMSETAALATETIVDDVHLVCTTEGRSFQNDETGNALEDGAEAEWVGYITAPSTGTYQFVIQANGGTAKVAVEGLDDEVSSSGTASDGVSWDYYTVEGLNYTAVNVSLTEGNRYKILVDAQQSSNYRDEGVKLGLISPTKADEDMDAALAAASTPNTKVVMFTRTGATGHGPVFNTDWDIALDEMDEIKAVQAAAKAAGNEFILVTFGRSAYSFEGDWLDDTDALLIPYYAGQAAGTAVSEILTGEVNPSGKLTVTMPKTNADTLMTYGYYGNDETEDDYNKVRVGDQSQGNYTANYTEGLNFGYRWYDSEEAADAEYQYPFGYGLSYTTFEYSNMNVTDNGDYTYTVTVDITNTGDVTGDEIAQLYLSKGNVNVPSDIQVVEKQLVGFDRVEDIEPGQTKTATMTVEQRLLSYYDDSYDLIERADGTADKWIVADGTRDLMVGGCSDNLVFSEEITIEPKTADVTCLENAIANAEGSKDATVAALVEAAEGWMNYVTLTGASEVDAQATATSIANALNAAVAAAAESSEENEQDLLAAMKAALQDLYDAYAAEDLSGYTAESAAALTDALNAAAAVLADESATIAQISDATCALVDAIGALQYSANTLHLETAIKAAYALLEDASGYDADDIAALTDAVAAGEAVLANTGATQDEVNAAASAILQAMFRMSKNEGLDSLESLVDAAEDLLAGDYTEDSLAALEDAIANAKDVIADPNRSEQDIIDAYEELIDAIIGMQMQGNKAALHAILLDAQAVLDNADAYVASSIDGLSALAAEAADVYLDVNATQDEIDEMVVALTLKVADARLLGDVNGDGVITTSDSVVLLQYAAEMIEISDADAASADVNADGIVDTSDAVLILQYAAEMIDTF